MSTSAPIVKDRVADVGRLLLGHLGGVGEVRRSGSGVAVSCGREVVDDFQRRPVVEREGLVFPSFGVPQVDQLAELVRMLSG